MFNCEEFNIYLLNDNLKRIIEGEKVNQNLATIFCVNKYKKEL